MSQTLSTQPQAAVRIARPHIPDEEKMIRLPMDIRIKAFEPYLTPAIWEQIRGEFNAYLGQPQYPVLVANRLLDFLCTACLPHLPLAAARQLAGYRYVERYRKTILGLLMKVAAPLVNVEWIMRGLPTQYARATNFGTYWVAELAPRHWRFDFEDDPGYPEWILGTLLAGGNLLKVQGLQVTYTVPAPQHMSFDIQWAVQAQEGSG